MKMKSIKHILAVAVFGSSLTVAANASAADWNYVGGGFYDFGDTGFYLEGSTFIADRLVLNAEIGDTYDTIFRAGVTLAIDQGVNTKFELRHDIASDGFLVTGAYF